MDDFAVKGVITFGSLEKISLYLYNSEADVRHESFLYCSCRTSCFEGILRANLQVTSYDLSGDFRPLARSFSLST